MGTALFIVAFVTIVGGERMYPDPRQRLWHGLAAQYPERTPYTGQWRRCGAFRMMAVDSDLSVATRVAAGMTRLSGGIVSAGVTRDALYIVAPSVVRHLFPIVQLPWTSIGSAKPFEASGWGEPIVTLEIRAHYDPSSRGEFIELETTAPKTCVRLPMYAIEDARSYLALS